jgi:hypothetical protein
MTKNGLPVLKGSVVVAVIVLAGCLGSGKSPLSAWGGAHFFKSRAWVSNVHFYLKQLLVERDYSWQIGFSCK